MNIAARLVHFEDAFAQVGWFIPLFAQMGFLSRVAGQILQLGSRFTPDDLEKELAHVYEPHGLAAMVTSRYAAVPYVSEYSTTISEAIEAHFLGLHHVAAGGLMPVVEGVGRQLLDSRGLTVNSGGPTKKAIKTVFSTLAEDCKCQIVAGKIGAVGEILSMLDSFVKFTGNVLYTDSKISAPLDGTNRHGIAHGHFRDHEYGRPLNFFKTIGAVDFLMFVASFNAPMSWFAPDPSDSSERLAVYYKQLQKMGALRPRNGA